ncbi:TPA: hypothetical protein ACW6D3_002686 [Legionella pneumophila]|uniref:hypothetical protein n=1 Tax=Legionella pneumophila TaxID=446 RepID=UPI0005C87F6E|nr:hypothetical protein [Legionella pneumophila]HCC3243582.1 hypothetical protein [Legionella pneumophila subsp. pneumophila]MCZ4683308.1 hypothetical protein [Legionella pneumophila]HDV5789947.1 hypothetical protein [Legionella pneumophila]HDV5798930.1 hypothetical protein [Legionella pneumophila]HDV5948495.1 hypothetical protein [Legionella pneumophila]
MMFMFHSAEMLGLIAIALGIMLGVWALRHEGRGTGLSKVFGWLIVIIGILGELCSTYYAIKYWYAGYFKMPMIQGEAFLFHTAQMLSLIAIALGIILVVWASRNEGFGISLAKVFGWLIVLLAILGMICSGYYATVYWYKGYIQTPADMYMTMPHQTSNPNQPSNQ